MERDGRIPSGKSILKSRETAQKDMVITEAIEEQKPVPMSYYDPVMWSPPPPCLPGMPMPSSSQKPGLLGRKSDLFANGLSHPQFYPSMIAVAAQVTLHRKVDNR